MILDIDHLNNGFLDLVHQCREFCDYLIVGIPDDELYLRMYNTASGIPFDRKIAMLKEIRSVDEVVTVDVDHLNIRRAWEQFSFDVYFFGTVFGRRFDDARNWLEERGVSFQSLSQNSFIDFGDVDSLRRALAGLSVLHPIVLFGTGKFFDYYMTHYGEAYPPAYAVDNDKAKWGTSKSGVEIRSPEGLKDDESTIILCMKSYEEALDQIKTLGEHDYRILLHDRTVSEYEEYSAIWDEQQEYLTKAHSILKKLMREIDRICTENDIRYYVISGSLIGIVRHQGIIPWDDDIDVAMPRADFEKFKKVIAEEWKDSDTFELLEYDEIGESVFYDFMTRVLYKPETIPMGLFEKAGDKARKDILDRMILDIYVLDNTVGGFRHKFKTLLIRMDYALGLGHRGILNYEDYDRLTKFELLLFKMVTKLGKLVPLRTIYKQYEKHRRYAEHQDSDYYFESGGVIDFMPDLYKKELYGDGTRLPMYDMKVMVPQDYDGLLKAKGYGDYMQFPAVNHRTPSHMKGQCRIIWGRWAYR